MSAVRNTVIGVALAAAGLAAGATGVALADNTPTPTTSSPSATSNVAPGNGDRRGPGGMGMGGMRGGHGRMGIGGALHGELVVPAPSGGYQTVLVQRGTVTAVSRTSITLKSADGFSATYVVTAGTLVNAARDGIATIKKGADVHVMALQKSGTATALHIGDQSLRKDLREQFATTAPPTA